jgi:acetylglutamate kinase
MYVSGQDIGFVGQIDKVSPALINLCRSARIIPVISPISRDDAGCIYNVNADLAAGELAMAIKADDLIFISDVPGVLIDGKVRAEIKTSEIDGLVEAGHITGGMVPKLRSAAEAVYKGVSRVHICGWNNSETLHNELARGEASGTVICL